MTEVPSALKFIQPTLARASELDSREPVIAYFCRLHAVQEILAKNLHQIDPEAAAFSSELLDTVEKAKTDEQSPLVNDERLRSIVEDDDASQAYVENFALKVFAKADNEVRQHKTTKATASTFMAAAVFLDVIRIFQTPLESSMAEKIKYAKYQAARILKAYKNGEDPNDYEPPEQQDPEDESLKEHSPTQGQDAGNNEPDAEGTAGASIEDSLKGTGDSRPFVPAQPSSYLQSSPESPPAGNTTVLPDAPPVLPKAPADAPVGEDGPTLPSAPSLPPKAPIQPPSAPELDTAPVPVPPKVAPASHSKPITAAEVATIMGQADIVSNVQKHAKYAISALNYEDIETATVELTKALELLGQYKN
uniref:ARAD1C32054p n=1 Tax=Blastobotrys adeninivorans TaxID=409370 RepID=A0A060T3D2_BLAAD